MQQAGLEEDVANHIIRSIPLSRQKQLCLLDPVQIMQELPDLMRDANCLDEFEMDPSYQEKPVPQPKDLLKDDTPRSETRAPLPIANKAPINKFKAAFWLILILGLSFYFLSSDDQETDKEIAITKISHAKVIKETEQSIKALKVATLPQLPPRGMWMLSTAGNFISKPECKDERFKNFPTDYTIELWLKVSQSITTEVNLLELLENEQPIERLFINSDGYICFSAGPAFPLIQHKSSIPANDRHYHLAITKSGNKYTLFINGKIKGELEAKLKRPKHRSAVQILRRVQEVKGLAIDEIRVSSEAIYSSTFIPERTFYKTAITLLYMPLEKNEKNLLRFYGIEDYSQSEVIEGGQWLNVTYETQQISNQLESLRESLKD